MKEKRKTFEGEVCKKCQSNIRHVSDHRCVHCEKNYYQERKEKFYNRQKVYRQSLEVKSRNSSLAKKYGATIQGKCSRLWSKAKARAEKRNLPFSITPELLQKHFQENHGKCNVTGVMLYLESIGNGNRHPFAPSIDQIVAGKGYTPDNIQIVAFAYNMLKSTLSDEDAKKCLVEMAAGLTKIAIP